MPSCAKATSDNTGLLDIPYGEGRSMMGGAVYKYRCNPGVVMDGRNTLVCDGEKWNGTVPDCNVEPNKPELEVIVSGSVVTTLKPGDWVLVTCQARGGHPVPGIGITIGGVQSGSKDFRNFRNSFTFTATEKDDGKKILCTAVNKVGSSEASNIIQVQTPPKNAAISGPEIIHHNDEFTFACSIDGGNPTPVITWTLRDHLGQTKEMAGENIGPGHSRMQLKTGSNERMLTINCVGENNQGIVSHTMHVHTQYLPKSVEITGPTSVTPGVYDVYVEKKSEIKEQERSKVLWIPLNPVKNIEDYKNMFASEKDRSFYVDEDFLRPSDIPEAPMLKQEKVAKSTVSHTPVSVSAEYSSSSTVSMQLVFIINTMCLSMLVHRPN